MLQLRVYIWVFSKNRTPIYVWSLLHILCFELYVPKSFLCKLESRVYRAVIFRLQKNISIIETSRPTYSKGTGLSFMVSLTMLWTNKFSFLKILHSFCVSLYAGSHIENIHMKQKLLDKRNNLNDLNVSYHNINHELERWAIKNNRYVTQNDWKLAIYVKLRQIYSATILFGAQTSYTHLISSQLPK